MSEIPGTGDNKDESIRIMVPDTQLDNDPSQNPRSSLTNNSGTSSATRTTTAAVKSVSQPQITNGKVRLLKFLQSRSNENLRKLFILLSL